MNGPKIISTPIEACGADGHAVRAPKRETGIRRAPSSTTVWQVIIDGRLVNEHKGLGAQSKAIREAGTSHEIR
jgi:hypothetical protein